MGAATSHSTKLTKSEFKRSDHNKEASRSNKKSSWQECEKGAEPIIEPFETSRINQKDQIQEGPSVIYDDIIHQLY
jgi:hypothetical protein